jgi:hypothetical protein
VAAFPTVVWVLLPLFMVVEQVEGNVLAPRVTGHAVGLHPLAALLAVLVGFRRAHRGRLSAGSGGRRRSAAVVWSWSVSLS